MKDLAIAQHFSFAGIHAGIKKERKDFALVCSATPARAAAVTTQNQIHASCVDRTRRLVPADGIRAVVINSGNANCLAGPQEAADDARLAELVAAHLDCPPEAILTASTGSIGVPLPMDTIAAAAPKLVEALSPDPRACAEALLTTDKVIKLSSRQFEVDGTRITVTGLAKGSGMIHPHMATMLGYLCTDADIAADELDALLKDAVDTSFNQISVDRDTSTNDMTVLLANGASGKRLDRSCQPLVDALQAVCRDLARAIAADGEGATRLISVEVSGADDLPTARLLSRAVLESNLFKSSLYGDATGWPRALAYLGATAHRHGISIDTRKIRVSVDDTEVVRDGFPAGKPPKVRGPEVTYRFQIGDGDGSAWAWGCDLSYDYVSINAMTKSEPLDTHSPGLKRRLLVEALSYMRRFKGSLAVIKYGGAAMLRDDLKNAFAEDLVLLKSVGLRPVVVHGGGPEISRTLDRMGQETQFVDGLRVTDEASIKVVEMVLTGSVNTDVVTRIHTHGGRAVGISGKDGNLLRARKLTTTGGKDLGRVGEIAHVRTEVIHMLLDADYIPVISPIGVDQDGKTFNINADTAAAEIAQALGAEKLIFLTDVPGVLHDKELVHRLSPSDVEGFIAQGVISGGMIPKAQALLSAVTHGVRSGHIIDGRIAHNLLAELFTDRGVGTWITAEDAPGT